MVKQKNYLSIDDQSNCLFRATTKYSSSPADKRAITDASYAAANTAKVEISDGKKAVKKARSAMMIPQKRLKNQFEPFKKLVLGHLETAIRKVKLGTLPQAALPLYELEIENPTLPIISTNQHLLDAARVIAYEHL